jgi:hypothetical protein
MSESAVSAEQVTPQQPSNARFNRGDLLPIKGVWFKIESIEPQRLVLVPVGLTAKSRKGKRR